MNMQGAAAGGRGWLLVVLMLAAVWGSKGGCNWTAGFYSHTCKDIWLIDGGMTLLAQCGDGHGNYEDTTLYLNEHVLNDNGGLLCSRCTDVGTPAKCEFSHSCEGMALINGHILQAQCNDDHGIPEPASLDLDNCIANRRGKLVWVC